MRAGSNSERLPDGNDVPIFLSPGRGQLSCQHASQGTSVMIEINLSLKTDINKGCIQK
jgi:hypothetical protein